MTATFEETFLEEHAREVARYHRMADRAMVQYVIVRLGLVIGSAALPALTTLADRGWAIGMAVLVAIFAGLDTQFQWGQEWQHFRSAEMALERAKREYTRQRDRISQESDQATRMARATRNFDEFYQNTDSILNAEVEKFWSFRITKWKSDKQS